MIFSDSKLALNAAVSPRRPLTNPALVSELRKLYQVLKSKLNVALCWIPGHAGVGGNERVDRISKAFALRDVTDPPHPFVSVRRELPWLFPLTETPAPIIYANFLRPAPLVIQTRTVRTKIPLPVAVALHVGW